MRRRRRGHNLSGTGAEHSGRVGGHAADVATRARSAERAADRGACQIAVGDLVAAARALGRVDTEQHWSDQKNRRLETPALEARSDLIRAQLSVIAKCVGRSTGDAAYLKHQADELYGLGAGHATYAVRWYQDGSPEEREFTGFGEARRFLATLSYLSRGILIRTDSKGDERILLRRASFGR